MDSSSTQPTAPLQPPGGRPSRKGLRFAGALLVIGLLIALVTAGLRGPKRRRASGRDAARSGARRSPAEDPAGAAAGAKRAPAGAAHIASRATARYLGAARLLPARTRMFVALEDVRRLEEAYAGSALHAILSHEDMVPFLARPRALLAKSLKIGPTAGGLTWHFLRMLLSGRVVLAALEPDGEPPGRSDCVLIAQVSDPAAARALAESVLTALRDQRGAREAPAEDVSRADWSRAVQLDGRTYAAALCRGYVVVSAGGSGTLASVLDALGGALPGTLAGSAAFRSGARHLQPDALAAVYVDLARLNVPPPLREALGLGAARALAASFRGDGPAFRQVLSLAGAGTSRGGEVPGLLDLVDREGVSDEALRAAPAGSRFVLAARMDLRGLFELLRRVQRAAAPRNARALDQFLDELDRNLGIQLRRDLLAALGDQIVLALGPAEGGAPGALPGLDVLNNLILSVAVTDALRLQETLTKVLTVLRSQIARRRQSGGRGLALAIRDVTYQGVKMHVIEIVTPINLQFRPTLVLTAERLLVAGHVQTMRRTIQCIRRKTSLVDGPQLAALRRAAGQSAGAAAGLRYIDWKSAGAAFYVSFRMGWETFGRGGGLRGALPFDMTLLPLPEVFVGPLFPEIGGLTADEWGLVYRARSPVPDAFLAAALPVIGRIAEGFSPKQVKARTAR